MDGAEAGERSTDSEHGLLERSQKWRHDSANVPHLGGRAITLALTASQPAASQPAAS